MGKRFGRKQKRAMREELREMQLVVDGTRMAMRKVWADSRADVSAQAGEAVKWRKAYESLCSGAPTASVEGMPTTGSIAQRKINLILGRLAFTSSDYLTYDKMQDIIAAFQIKVRDALEKQLLPIVHQDMAMDPMRGRPPQDYSNGYHG